MEIKELKTCTVALLDGGQFAVNGVLCPTWSAAVKTLGVELGVVARPRKPRQEPKPKKQ